MPASGAGSRRSRTPVSSITSRRAVFQSSWSCSRDMAAWQQPAIQLRVVDQEQPLAIGGEHQAGGGEVAGGELVARERRGSIQKQKKGQVPALERGGVGRVVEGFDQLSGLFDGKHATMVARIEQKKISPPVPEGYLFKPGDFLLSHILAMQYHRG